MCFLGTFFWQLFWTNAKKNILKKMFDEKNDPSCYYHSQLYQSLLWPGRSANGCHANVGHFFWGEMSLPRGDLWAKSQQKCWKLRFCEKLGEKNNSKSNWVWSFSSFPHLYSRKTNMSPENQWLEDVFPTEIVPLKRGHSLVFRGVVVAIATTMTSWPRLPSRFYIVFPSAMAMAMDECLIHGTVDGRNTKQPPGMYKTYKK